MRIELQCPITSLTPAPWNPRGAVDDAAVADLVASVREQGILTPLLARPREGHDGRYEIVAGHRRHRAAQLAGLETVPVHAWPMSDDEARTLAITENLQRADLHPLDEAAGFADLARRGLTHAFIAGKVSKPTAYVAGRIALERLTPEAVRFFRNGVILLGHARILATLLPADQAKALTFLVPVCGDDYTVDAAQATHVEDVDGLARWVRAQVLQDLSRAIWPIQTFTVDTGLTCLACPQRGGLNYGLFSEDDGALGEGPAAHPGYCHNGACYTEKQSAWLDEVGARAAEQAGLPLVRVAAGGGKGGKGILKPAAYTSLKPSMKPCDDTRMAVVVSVGHYGYSVKLGDTFRACIAKTCAKHGRAVEPKAPKKPGAAADDRDDSRSSGYERSRAAAEARLKAREALRLRLMALATWPLPDGVLALALRELDDRCGGQGAETLLPGCPPEAALARLLVALVVDGNLGSWEGCRTEELEAVCAAYDVPFDAACE
jgi:ParB/RepB/Spo0J family partition protein